MKTIKTQQIGEYQIITGFDELPIDPEATKTAAAETVIKLPEFEAMRTKQREKEQKLAFAKTAFSAAHEYLLSGDESNADLENIKYQNYTAAAAVCESELAEISKELRAKVFEIRRQNPRYFEPRENEIVKTDAEWAELLQAYNAKLDTEQLDVEGKLIADYRGKQWFYQADGVWYDSEKIEQLGATMSTVVPDEYESTAIEKADLTAEQSEEIRIQNLTAEQKTAEKEAAIDAAATQAATMRTKLEIQGDAEALTKSQAWYQEQVTLIEAKYA